MADSKRSDGRFGALFARYKKTEKTEGNSTPDVSTSKGQKRGELASNIEGNSGFKKPPRGRTFWQKAFQEILDDNDAQNRKLLREYNVLLKSPTEQLSDDAQGNAIVVAENEDPTNHSLDLPKDDGRRVQLVGNEKEMRRIAAEKLALMQRKEWIITWKGQVFKVRDQVTRIVRIVQSVSGLISQGTAAAPMPAGLAWAGVCVLLPLVVNETDQRQEAIDGIEDLATLTARYGIVESNYASRPDSRNYDFEKALIALYRKIATYYIKAACFFSKSTLRRGAHGIVTPDDWKSARSAVRMADEECHKYILMLSLSSALTEIEGIIKKLDKMESRDHIDGIKQWLLMDADADVDIQHRNAKKRLGPFYSKSGKWLLDSTTFKTWAEGFEGQFWIQGPIGTGKTSLISVIIDHLRSDHENVAFFYCANNDSDPTRILCNLIWQLALPSENYRVAEEVELCFERDGRAGQSYDPRHLDREQAKHLLVQLIESRNDITIIIDGLDECPQFMEVLDILKDIDDKTHSLKILFSSQYVVPVDGHFPLTKKLVTGGKSNFSDMKSFLNGKVQEFNRRRSSPYVLDESLSNDIVQTISTAAGGMFTWAQLCLNDVLDERSEETASEIRSNWNKLKIQGFQGLIKGVIRMYDKLYNDNLPMGSSARRTAKEKAERTLLWVLGAVRPLTHDEYFMVQDGVEPGSQGATTAQISPLNRHFLYFSVNDTMALSHSSVRDYLSLKFAKRISTFLACPDNSEAGQEEQKQILVQARRISAQLAQNIISRDCLRILLGPQDEKSPMLEYACGNWLRHVDACRLNGKLPDDLLSQIKQLFNPHNQALFRRWLSVHDPDKLEGQVMPSEEPASNLYYSILMGYPEIVQWLLENGATLSSGGGRLGLPLQLACFKGNLPLVSIMLGHNQSQDVIKAAVSQADDVLGTPLQAAVAGGHEHVMIELIDKFGADINARAGALGNAVQIALTLENMPCVQILFERDTRLKDQGSRGSAWAKAWDQVSDIDRRKALANIANVRRLATWAPRFPPEPNPKLQLLIYCNGSDIVSHRNKEYYDGRRRRLIDMAAMRNREDDLDSIGFLPRRLAWRRLLSLSTRVDRTFDWVITCMEILERHESFLLMSGGDIQDDNLIEVIIEIFTLVMILVLHSSKDREEAILKTSLLAESENRLRDLHEEAKRLEDDYRSSSRIYRLLAEHDRQVTEAMREMAKGISDIKEDVSAMKDEISRLRGDINRVKGYLAARSITGA